MVRKLFAGVVSALLVACFAACDAVNLEKLKPGMSTAFEVRDRMGSPSMEWKEADGTLIWEYPRTPEGMVNYMLVIGPDNLLREIRQVLTEENFGKVKPGMTKEEVRRLLGKPAHEVYFSLKKELVWDWKTRKEAGMDWFFNVHFNDAGVVTGTSSNFVAKG